MDTKILYSRNFPQKGARLFFVGIGGIGMSALAQYLVTQGYVIAGSDRGLDEPAKAQLYDKLRGMGIALFEQDGSGVNAFRPEAFVVSAAIELDTNSDIQAAPSLPVIHRAYALSQAMSRSAANIIGVAGSCGKSSVTAWIASALNALDYPFAMINGGYVVDFLNDKFPGNFYANSTAPKFVVAEIDESDQSINEFSPDYGMVLNVGDDHYERAELEAVFANFLNRCTRGAVAASSIEKLLPQEGICACFTESVNDYQSGRQGISFAVDGLRINCAQSGRHSAVNGAAVFTMLKMVCGQERTDEAIADSLASFKGVLQRFEVMSKPGAPIAFINDYAHNPEKIAAAIATAHERFGTPVIAIFQPHGFTPLRFMREALKEHLMQVLTPEDKFLMLPVYYAGGTAAFSPTSEEVALEYAKSGLPVIAIPDRKNAEDIIRASKASAVIVLGARDASLRTWCAEISLIRVPFS